ncbi:MAG: sigma 54-interacting transcriptional regulator [Bryobacteraceae bacterium]
MASPAILEAGSDESIAARYESLIRLADSIRAHRTPRDLFGVLVEELQQVVPFDGIAQFDESANKIQWHLCEECTKSNLLQPRKENTVAWWVYQNQQSVVIHDIWRETRFQEQMRAVGECGLRSLCVVPLTTAHRRLGSLALGSRAPYAYSEEEVRFVSLVAAQIALAMDDGMNSDALRRAQERLELLLALTNRIVSNLDLRVVLREISASIRRVMQCEGVSVVLPDRETSSLRIFALDIDGSHDHIREGVELPAAKRDSLLEVLQNGRPAVLDMSGDTDPSHHGLKSLCYLPLVSRERVLGILTLASNAAGAFPPEDLEFLRQLANQVAIAVENALAYGQITELKEKLAEEKLYLEDEIRSELNFEEIVGKSEALRQVLKQVESVAPTDSTVLIYGETGTGKELVARALHNLGARRSSAFVKLNCAAIPTGLLESELFGHEKGAFTGAIAQRVGRFELANHGTVFLDEVGEIPLELQPKLLRVLQEREFERLGSSRTLRTDARLIAATNRDLAAMVDENRFRPDLYYRLNVFPIRVPSLRERPVDIPLLVRHFVQQFSRRLSRHIDTIPSEVMEALVRYHWPGNIRELQNVLERAVILSTGSVLRVATDDLRIANHGRAEVREPASGTGMQSVLDDTERQQILAALERSNWVVAGPNGAAARLGMKRSTLQSHMRRVGISTSRSGRVTRA